MKHPPPPIPESLIRYLREIFPPHAPSKESVLADVHFSAGEQKVITRLETEMKNQQRRVE